MPASDQPRTALITGATSGFGRATARRLVRDGWQVVGTGRRAERLNDLAAELGAAFRGVAFDLRDRDAMAEAIDSLPAEFVGIDLLVNNAGIGVGMARLQEANLDDLLAMIETNVTAMTAITHRLLPALIARRGAIVNLSSVLATATYAGSNVYGASKAFVRQFSIGLRSDLHGTGVRVTSIEPGLSETEFYLERTRGDTVANDAYYRDAHPLTADDMAETIAWMANLPPHVNVTSLEVVPVSQSLAGFNIHRDA